MVHLRETLELYEVRGLTEHNLPGNFWQLYDEMAVAYGSVDDHVREIEHYEKAIAIVSRMTVPPEVHIPTPITLFIDMLIYEKVCRMQNCFRWAHIMFLWQERWDPCNVTNV